MIDNYRRRQAYLTKGKELLKDGKRSEAVDCFQKSVDVSHEMALALIKVHRFTIVLVSIGNHTHSSPIREMQ